VNSDQTFDINLKNADLNTALDLIARRSGKRFVIEPGVYAPITVKGSSLRFDSVLNSLAKAAGATWSVHGGLYTFTHDHRAKSDKPQSVVTRTSGGICKVELGPDGSNFDLDLKEIKLSRAAEMVTRLSGKKIVVEPAADGILMELRRDNLSFDELMTALLQATAGDVWSVDSDVYTISRGKP
jgi:type II secretory pathway component GspD/PulD (secretin)